MAIQKCTPYSAPVTNIYHDTAVILSQSHSVVYFKIFKIIHLINLKSCKFHITLITLTLNFTQLLLHITIIIAMGPCKKKT